MKSFNMKHTPNYSLMICNLNKLPDIPMYINLHWLGFPRLRATNYFNHNELAVINMILNLTRLTLLEEEEEELAKLRLFETKVKGPTAKYLRKKMNHLSPTSMLAFAEVFMDQLEDLATCSSEAFEECVTPYCAGMSFAVDLKEELSVPYMRCFTKSLFNNCYFVASLPGCKGFFHSRPDLHFVFEAEEHLTMDFLRSKILETTRAIYDFLRSEVFRIEGRRNQNDGNIQYHIDMGIEFSPLKGDTVSFLLNGNRSKVCFKEFMNRTRTLVRFVPDPVARGVIPDVEVVLAVPDPPVPEPAPAAGLELSDVFDLAELEFFQTGEVLTPSLARRVDDEGYADDPYADDPEMAGMYTNFCFCFQT
jgi:hypothetical protein